MISAIELMDRFQILLTQENTTYRFDDYLSPSYQLQTAHRHGEHTYTKHEATTLSDHKTFWRSKLCAWMYFVVDDNDLSRELVSISTAYMDRYLSKRWSNNCEDHQLLGMTALYIAIKLHRHNGKCAGVSSFVKLSKGLFKEEDFLTMENNMLETLEWRMHPPTVFAYLDLLILFVPPKACSSFTRKAMFERIKFLLELSATVQFFFAKKPSNVAIAAFIEVMEYPEEPRILDLKYHAHFKKCILSIAGVNCDALEVAECRDAMAVVHSNYLRDKGDDMDVRKNCVDTSPTRPNGHVTVVSP